MKLKSVFTLLLPLLITGPAVLRAQVKIATGPAVGTKVPDFEAVDQNGVSRSLKSIMGPKGAMVVFFRSADW